MTWWGWVLLALYIVVTVQTFRRALFLSITRIMRDSGKSYAGLADYNWVDAINWSALLAVFWPISIPIAYTRRLFKLFKWMPKPSRQIFLSIPRSYQNEL